MKPQENQDWETKLQQLEKEIDRTSFSASANDPQNQQVRYESKKTDNFIVSVKQWFGNLPTPGKLAVVIGGALIGFSLLKSVLQIVSSLLGIVFFGAMLYLIYKFFIAPRSRE